LLHAGDCLVWLGPAAAKLSRGEADSEGNVFLIGRRWRAVGTLALAGRRGRFSNLLSDDGGSGDGGSGDGGSGDGGSGDGRSNDSGSDSSGGDGGRSRSVGNGNDAGQARGSTLVKTGALEGIGKGNGVD